MRDEEAEPVEPADDEPGEPRPGAAVRARGLGIRTRRGWVFRDVDVDLVPGELVAVTGPSASGRTSLLLALAGHFRTTHGSVAVDRPTALGYVSRVHEPEAGLTVLEHVTERLLLLGRAPWRPRHRLAAARRVLEDYPLDPGTLGRDLDAYGSHLLCLALAQLRHPGLIVVDDADVALSTAEHTALWKRLRRVDATVVVACREVDPALPDRIVTLPAAGVQRVPDSPARHYRRHR
jgi:ABC-2 type transport system ATP-binding protein